MVLLALEIILLRNRLVHFLSKGVPIIKDALTRFRFKLEFHDLINLTMILFVVSLFSSKLRYEGFKFFSHFILEGSPITKLFIFLLLMLGIVCRIVTHTELKESGWFVFRIMSSFLVMLFCFESITYYIQARELPLKDALFQYLDTLIFWGKQPAVWLEPFSSAPLTLILSAAYLAWFLLLYGTVFLLLFRGRQAVLEYTAISLLTFYIGYIFYILFPGIGPLHTYSFSTPMGGLTQVLVSGELIKPSADIFPSLHTALSVVMFVQVWRHFRIWTWLYGPMALLIIFSTIYLRIHYGVDVLAGIVLAILTTQVCPRLMFIWEQSRNQKIEAQSRVHPKLLLPLSGHKTLYKEM
jgi:membrane-associated phospholipid phosphatase